MAPTEPDTDELLDRSAAGDASACEQLLARHRTRLRRMVAIRMDPRLAPRVDPSDVVQEALADAARKLDRYLRDRPLPFYPWLRQLAWERVLQAHRRHLHARRRSVTREAAPALPNESAAALADRLFARGSSPSRRTRQADDRAQVRVALAALPDRDREVLVLRYLEGLSVGETAAVLGITEVNTRVRHLRAIERLRRLIGNDSGRSLR